MSSVHSANKAFKSLKQLLNREQRLRTRFISWFSALIAMADIVGLSSMVPVLMLAIDHSFLEKSSKLRALYTFFHFQSEPEFLKALIAIIILFFLVKNVAAIWLMRYVRKTAIDIASTLSSKSYQYAFRNNSYGQVASDGLGFNDTVLFTPFYYVSGIYLPLLNIISESAVVLMLVAVFTIYKPILFLLIAGLLGIGFFLVNRYTRKKITQLGEQGSQMREAALKDLNFGVSGFTDIRIHGVEDFFRDKFLVHFTGFAKNGVKAISYQLIPARINEFVALIGIVALVIYGYFYSQENLGQVRVLAALFAISVFRLIPAANRLLQALMHLKLNGYTIDKLMPVAVEAPVKAQASPTFSDNLELRQVCYGYENAHHTVLENVNLHIAKGSIIGLSGASGAGKSTLVKILMGMYAPSNGEVLLDGARVENQEQVMSLFGFMGQDPYLLKIQE
jgi:ABC-type multidrug transport system fused ATPase/permease subunit